MLKVKNPLLFLFLIILVGIAVFLSVNRKPAVKSVAVPEVKPLETITDSRYGGTLVYARGADAEKLDPADTSDGEAMKVCYHLYDGLLRFKVGGIDVEPALATRWESSEDGLIWRFYLRRGVKFHDGSDFNADAVVFSFMRQLDVNHPYHNGKFPTWQGLFAQYINNVEKIDEYTVKIILDKPFAPLLSGLSMFAMSIISPKAMKELGKEGFDKHGVGTGPFKFVEWTVNDRIVLEANEDYWDGRPYLDRVVYKVVPDNSIRTLQLQSGASDVIDGLAPYDVARIKRDPNLSLSSIEGLNVGYLAMHTEKAPFNDKRVRQAVNYAINKDPLVKVIYQGLATLASNPLPPTLWGHNDDLKPYEYNPQKAKELLAQAGYPDGFSFTLDVMKNPRPYMPEPVKVAQAIKQNLSMIGINVTLRINDWKEHLQITVFDPKTDYQACILGWFADMPDPNDFLYVLLSKDTAVKEKGHNNQAMYVSEEYSDLVGRANQIYDKTERIRLYKQAQIIVHEDVPLIPLAHGLTMIAFNKNKVKNLVVDPLENHRLTRVWIEK